MASVSALIGSYLSQVSHHLVLNFSNAFARLSYFCCNAQRFFNRNYGRQLEVKRQHRCLMNSFKSRSELSNTAHKGVKEMDVSEAALIWRAIKLPIYSVALVPLTVGSATAYMQTGVFLAKRYFVLLASSVLIITWLNLSNDVYDYDTGADKDKNESVVNMVGSRTGTLIAAYALLALGSLGLTWVSTEAGNVRSILLLACAIICGYIYQLRLPLGKAEVWQPSSVMIAIKHPLMCPPFRLSYQGLGEPLCFAAFGPFATTAFYLLQNSTRAVNSLPLTSTMLSASLLVGFTTTLILFCSHFHQVEGDIAVGKMSPLVRLGTEAGSRVVKVAVMTLYSLLVPLALSRALPLTCIFCCALTLPIGKLVVNYVEENHKVSSELAYDAVSHGTLNPSCSDLTDLWFHNHNVPQRQRLSFTQSKTKIFMAKYYCVRLHALFGAGLAAGLVAARMISERHIPRLIFP